jgi:hypothetical protein
MEVYQEANSPIRHFQVGEQLGFMHGSDPFYGFHFYDHSVLDNDIHPITAIQHYTFVGDRQPDLAFKTQRSLGQFKTETLFVSGLEKPGSDSSG